MGRRISLKREALKWFTLGFFSGALLALGKLTLAENEKGAGNLGASYLGMCHKDWPCSKSLTVFEGLEVKRVGWLHMTFGNPKCPCAQKFLELEGQKEIRVHLTNGTCFKERGRVCGPREPFHGLSILEASKRLERNNPQLINRLKASWEKARPLVEKARGAGVEVYLSPCLECPLSRKSRVKLLSLAREMFPGIPLVDSVMMQKCLDGFVCEKHGKSPKVKAPCIIDSDGDDFRSLDLEGFKKLGGDCEISFLWSRGMNLLPEKPQGFVDPKKRSGKDAPSAAEFRALREALRP